MRTVLLLSLRLYNWTGSLGHFFTELDRVAGKFSALYPDKEGALARLYEYQGRADQAPVGVARGVSKLESVFGSRPSVFGFPRGACAFGRTLYSRAPYGNVGVARK
jgi:hypothetical protein